MKTLALALLAVAVWLFVAYSYQHQPSARDADSRPDYAGAIAHHQLLAGMTVAQVIASWGPPLETHRTTSGNGTSEEWRFENDRFAYLDDGQLARWSESSGHPYYYRPPVSELQATGGGYNRDATHAPNANGLQGTALDQKAH